MQRVNRGNGWPRRFDELVAAMPADGRAMDCGGGDRCYGDPRVINLEMTDYPTVDVVGSVLDLPFEDDTFDVILSQAVLEHVPDPQRAVDEMARVLKPGGTLLVEAAFMQPGHLWPHHFFNVTINGMRYLARNLNIVTLEAFNDLDFTVPWMIRAAGLGDGLAERVGRLLAGKRSTQLELVASAVRLEATKPRSS
jgi:SAM-dependent methyltransferase